MSDDDGEGPRRCYPDWVWRSHPRDATATELYGRLLDQAVVVGSAATDLLADTALRVAARTGQPSSTPIGGTNGYRTHA